MIKVDNVSDPTYLSFCRQLMKHLSAVSLLLLKMAIQCTDFCYYSQSILTIASLYAATAFLKHSEDLSGAQTLQFVNEVRSILDQIIKEERREQRSFIP